MEKPRRSWIRPGHGAMSLFVLFGLPFDLISMTFVEALFTRFGKMFIKAFLLGGWYETQREVLVDRFVPDDHPRNTLRRLKVALIDGVWLAMFSSVFYTAAIVIQHQYRPDKSVGWSLFSVGLNAFGCLIFGGPFGVLLESLQRLWVWGQGRGPRGILLDGYKEVCRILKR